jgi:hypothetical protein
MAAGLNDLLQRAMADRAPATRRPSVQVRARRLTETARQPYRRGERPNAAYRGPGRGVSGESTN